MDFQKDINYESDRNKQNISIDVTQGDWIKPFNSFLLGKRKPQKLVNHVKYSKIFQPPH